MDIQSCFKILEIRETDSIEEIKQAYRDLIAIWHPDRYVRNPRLQQKATEKVKALNSAYKYLLDNMPRIKAASEKERGTAQQDPRQRVVLCPRCHAMNRLQADEGMRHWKCICCNHPLLHGEESFETAGKQRQRKKTDGFIGRKRKRIGIGRMFLMTVVSIGCAYMIAGYVKQRASSETDAMPPEIRALNADDIRADQAQLSEIRGLLAQLSYDPGPRDGVHGERTLAAVNRFIQDFSFQSDPFDMQKMQQALTRHAAIARVHPEWPRLHRNGELARWIDTQTMASPETCRQVLASGSMAQVASLLARYQFDNIKPDPVSLPTNGIVRKAYVKGFAPLTIQTRNEGAHFFIKLIKAEDGGEAFAAFLKSGFGLTEYVPAGKYSLKYAVGKTWYGEKWLFGSQTVFETLDQVLDFSLQGSEIKGYRLKLYLSPLRDTPAPTGDPFDF